MVIPRCPPLAPPPLAVPVLSPEQRRKLDESSDALFYAQPRFVQHLDEAFRQRLTALYRERLIPGTTVLDLMSSWVSHLPHDLSLQAVIGHGMNAAELEANPCLSRHWVQNLNEDQTLPLEPSSVDAALIVAFSNRMFATKAPQAWLEGSDRDRLSGVAKVLLCQGWELDQLLSEDTTAAGPLGWIGGKGDPFFAVIARKPAGRGHG